MFLILFTQIGSKIQLIVSKIIYLVHSIMVIVFPNLFSSSPFTPMISSLSLSESFAGIILALLHFLIGLSIISYGLSIFVVGETLMFIIFKKISDDDNILIRKDEDDIEEDEDSEILDLNIIKDGDDPHNNNKEKN